jgi:hypothetical protein
MTTITPRTVMRITSTPRSHRSKLKTRLWLLVYAALTPALAQDVFPPPASREAEPAIVELEPVLVTGVRPGPAL